MGAIVGAVHDNGIFGNAQFIQQVQHLAHVLIVLNHRIVVFRLPATRLPPNFIRRVNPEVHPGGIEPDEEGLVIVVSLSDEAFGLVYKFDVAGLHTLFGQRAGILNFLLPHPA